MELAQSKKLAEKKSIRTISDYLSPGHLSIFKEAIRENKLHSLTLNEIRYWCKDEKGNRIFRMLRKLRETAIILALRKDEHIPCIVLNEIIHSKTLFSLAVHYKGLIHEYIVRSSKHRYYSELSPYQKQNHIQIYPTIFSRFLKEKSLKVNNIPLNTVVPA